MTSRITARPYDLFLTRTQKLAVVMPVIMGTLIPLIFISVFSSHFDADPAHPQPPFFPYFPFAFFFVFAAFYGWTVASLPYRITATIDQTVVFKSLLRERTVRVSELVSIEPRGLRVQAGVSGYLLKHQAGSIRVPGQFTGFYILLTELKAANPGFEIRGC